MLQPLLRQPVTCAITDRTLFGRDERDREAGLLQQVERLARTNIDFIQLREKDLPAQDLLRLARNILEIIRVSASSPRLLINSRADIAAAAGAHGVHLPSGGDQLTPAQARRTLDCRHTAELPSQVVVSVSCHNLADVQRARDHRADLILFGPVFGKSVHGSLLTPAVGLEALREACAAAGPVPVLALGGVTTENKFQCLAAGAQGTAAIRLFS